MSKHLSDFDVMRWHRLPNWGRWGRDDPDKPDPNKCGHSICVAYIPKSEDWDWESPPEAFTVARVDFRDAEHLDGFIMQLSAAHKQTICRFFYKRQPAQWEKLDEAIRGLLDLLDANRVTVERMKSLGAA